MKKIYIIFFLSLLLISCSSENTTQSLQTTIKPINIPSPSLSSTPIYSTSPFVPSPFPSPSYYPIYPSIYPWPMPNYPSITSIDPSEGTADREIIIYGYNFDYYTGSVVFIKNNNSYSGKINSWDPSKIKVQVPSNLETGTYQVIVYTYGRSSNYKYYTVISSSSSPTPTPTSTITSTPTPTTTPTTISTLTTFTLSGKVINCCNTTPEYISNVTITANNSSNTSNSSGEYNLSYNAMNNSLVNVNIYRNPNNFSAYSFNITAGNYSNTLLPVVPKPVPADPVIPTLLPAPTLIPSSEINLPYVLSNIGIGANKPGIYIKPFTVLQTQNIFGIPQGMQGIYFGCFANSTEPDVQVTEPGTFMILPLDKKLLDSSGYSTIATTANLIPNPNDQGTGELAKLKEGDIVPIFRYHLFWQPSVPGVVVKADYTKPATNKSKWLADALLRGLGYNLANYTGNASEVNGRMAIIAPLPSFGFYGACYSTNSITPVIQF